MIDAGEIYQIAKELITPTLPYAGMMYASTIQGAVEAISGGKLSSSPLQNLAGVTEYFRPNTEHNYFSVERNGIQIGSFLIEFGPHVQSETLVKLVQLVLENYPQNGYAAANADGGFEFRQFPTHRADV
jgi:hypothetical protein